MKQSGHVRIASLAAVLLLISATTAPISAQSFDFESAATGYFGSPLDFSDGGLTLTVGGAEVLYFIQSGVSSVGVGVIGSHTNPLDLGQFAPLTFSFSQPLSAITFNYGDGGGDEDSPVTISWFSLSNTLLGSFVGPADNTSAGTTTVLTNLGNASYFEVSSGSGSGNENSIYWDIGSATAASVVPEPATMTLLATGLVGMATARRKKRRK